MKGNRYIDEQILRDILSRLPLKSLVRFKCVSKSWQSLIEKDAWLTNSHHHRQLKTSPRLFYSISKDIISESPSLVIRNLMVPFPRDENVEFESHCNLCIDTNHKEIIAATTTIQAVSNKELLACEQVQKPINGMICLIDKIESDCDKTKGDHAACLYNVITQEATPWIRSTYLAQVEKWCDLSELNVNRTYEFGFDPTTKEYKVICMWIISGWELQEFEGCGEYTLYENTEDNEADYKMCEILTLGKDTAWRRIDKVPPSAYYQHKDIHGSVYSNGSIYWTMYEGHRPILVAFDVGSEEYRIIPDLDMIGIDRPMSYSLMSLDGHLVIVKNADNYRVILWILDDACDKNTNTSTIKWTEENIMLPRLWSYRSVRLHAVEATDYLILELFDVQSYEACFHDAVFVHSYNRKKKIFSKIEITRDENYSLGVNIGHPSYKFTKYVESLLTLQRSYRPATEAPNSSSTNDERPLSDNV
ncbi:putative F-box protein At5g62660 [Papaver somniferum]|uniref:putative F-box protein At5g62660 n=1 Tax=Papaver somniferum TaxID=3469 RepID=UPI000E70460F|nr:putative F-box protein At5g62660 [Papaver somniferum]